LESENLNFSFTTWKKRTASSQPAVFPAFSILTAWVTSIAVIALPSLKRASVESHGEIKRLLFPTGLSAPHT